MVFSIQDFNLELFDKESNPTYIIGRMVRNKVWPFRLGETTIWLQDDIDFLRHLIRIECRTFPGKIFSHQISHEMFWENRIDAYFEIGKAAADFFASQMDLAPEDNIILGEY